jgi:hypothetical protein
LTRDIITTYGVSAAAAAREGAVTSAWSLDEEIGARWAVYEIGMEMPVAAKEKCQSA